MPTIGELFDVRVGYLMSRAVEKDESVECIELPVLSLSKSGIQKDERMKKRIKHSFYEQHKDDQLLKENDILVSLVYPFESRVVTKDLESCIVSNFCAILRAKNPDEINVRYVQEVLSSDAFIGPKGAFAGCLKECSKLTSVITLKELKKLNVSLPHIYEQIKVEQDLLSVRRRVQLLKKALDAERAYGNALINDAPEADQQEKAKLIEEYNQLMVEVLRLVGKR